MNDFKETFLQVFNNYNDFGKESYNYVKGEDHVAYVDNIFSVIYWLRLEVIWRPLNVVFTSNGEYTEDGLLKGSVIIRNIGYSNYKNLPNIPDGNRIVSLRNFLADYPTIETIEINNTINLEDLYAAFANSNVQTIIINTEKLKTLTYCFQNNTNEKLNVTFTINHNNTLSIDNIIDNSVFDRINIIDKNKDTENHYKAYNLSNNRNASKGNYLRIDNATIYLFFDFSIESYENYIIKSDAIKEIFCDTFYFHINNILEKVTCNHFILDDYKNSNYKGYLQNCIWTNTINIDTKEFTINKGTFNRLNFDLNNLKTINININAWDDEKVTTSGLGYFLYNNTFGTNLNTDDIENIIINCLNEYVYHGLFISNKVDNDLWNKYNLKFIYCWKDNTYTKYANIELNDVVIDTLYLIKEHGDIIINGLIKSIYLDTELYYTSAYYGNKEIGYLTCNTENIIKLDNTNYIANLDILDYPNIYITDYQDKIFNYNTNDVISGSYINRGNFYAYDIFKNCNIYLKTDYRCYFYKSAIDNINNNNVYIKPLTDEDWIKTYMFNEPAVDWNNIQECNINNFINNNTIKLSIDNIAFGNSSNSSHWWYVIFKVKDKLPEIHLRGIASKYIFSNFRFLQNEENPIYLHSECSLSEFEASSYNINTYKSVEAELSQYFVDNNASDTFYINCVDAGYIMFTNCFSTVGIVSIKGTINISLPDYSSIVDYNYDNTKNVLTDCIVTNSQIIANSACLYNYSNLNSDSINSIIANINDNTENSIKTLYIKRSLYNKILEDNISSFINKNYQFSIMED